MTAPCPNCGSDLPTGLARICLACYSRVERFPEGTPLGRARPAHRLTWADAGAAVLLFLGVVVALKAALAALDVTPGSAPALFAASACLVGCAALARVAGARA